MTSSFPLLLQTIMKRDEKSMHCSGCAHSGIHCSRRKRYTSPIQMESEPSIRVLRVTVKNVSHDSCEIRALSSVAVAAYTHT